MGTAKNLKTNQEQRTKAPNMDETPRNQSKGSVGGGPSGGILAPIKFSVKKPRQK